MKKISIVNCGQCPHKDHKGAFGQVAYVPRCKATGLTLPYTERAVKSGVIAMPTNEIPTWCPLEDDSDTQRLLWLEQHPEFNLIKRKKRWACITLTSYAYNTYSTLREAIDAAILNKWRAD